MADINMNIVESLNFIRSTTKLTKQMQKSLDEYFDNMELPEEIDKAKRGTIKIWMRHYMDGNCTMESLKNIMRKLGVADLLAEPFHKLEVSEDGEIEMYDISGN